MALATKPAREKSVDSERLSQLRRRAAKMDHTPKGSAEEIAQDSLKTFRQWKDVRKRATKKLA